MMMNRISGGNFIAAEASSLVNKCTGEKYIPSLEPCCVRGYHSGVHPSVLRLKLASGCSPSGSKRFSRNGPPFCKLALVKRAEQKASFSNHAVDSWRLAAAVEVGRRRWKAVEVDRKQRLNVCSRLAEVGFESTIPSRNRSHVSAILENSVVAGNIQGHICLLCCLRVGIPVLTLTYRQNKTGELENKY